MMSSYSRITRHPVTGRHEIAEYIDSYFMRGVYGVKFPSDEKVYPQELVDNNQVKNFFSADVIEAFKVCRPFKLVEKAEIIIFLDQIQKEYKNRWKRDPINGENDICKEIE